MTATLTAKQEAFALAYVEHGSAATAYRAAYSVGLATKPETVHVNASKLLSDTKVAPRIAALQAVNAARVGITVDTITDMLKEDRQLAYAERDPKAALAASVALAKLYGLIADKSDAKTTATTVTILTGVDRPPPETRDEWLARRRCEIGLQQTAGKA